jgi:hypothetical protein
MQNEWSICESSVHTETVENSEVEVRICWRHVRFSRLLLSLQVTAAERTKRTLLSGLMPCEMGIENPWIPWFPSCLSCFLPSPFVIYVTSRDGNIFSTRKREYLRHCVVWSQLTSTRGARPLFCLQRKVASLFYEQQNDNTVANWLQSSANSIPFLYSAMIHFVLWNKQTRPLWMNRYRFCSY